MKRLERLLNLTAALRNAEVPLSAETLRTRLGAGAYPEDKVAFRRSFERDKAILRAAGIPLLTAPVPLTDPPAEGYRIDKSAYASRRSFEPDELAALQLAAGLVRLEGSESDLARLGAAGDGDSAVQGRLGYHPANNVLIPAAADRKAVAFDYKGRERVVEPWVVGFFRGHWYLAAHDRMRGARRTFRVDRIEGTPRTVGDAVEPVGSGVDPFAFRRSWEFPEQAPVTARVAIDAAVAGMARSLLRLSDEEVEPGADGGLVATLEVRDPAGLRYGLLELGDRAEILDPPELRAEMIAWLEALL